MALSREAKEDLEYVGKFYQLVYNLQGTDEFEAYFRLFPNTQINPKADYKILKDRKNRKLMVVLYQGDSISIEDLARATGLKVDDISARIELFRANGMRQVRIRNAA